MPPLDTDQTSQHISNWYSFTHITNGFLFFALFHFVLGKGKWPWGVSVVLSVLLEVIWEILENTDWVVDKYRTQTISLGYFGDSIANSIGDVVYCILGIVLAMNLPWWASVAYVLGSEVLLALWIRDNMALNIMMLLYPLE
jgi:hypothetical protein